MADPEIAGRRPEVLELEPGTYYWCACGLSKKQPFCDGSHSGGEFTPVEFSVAEPRRVALCTCKRTGARPFCDGTHSRLPPGG